MKKIVFAMAIALAAVSAHAAQNSSLTSAIDKLITDVKADVANSNVTKQELENLEVALEAAASTAHQPNPTLVTQLKQEVDAVKQQGSATQAQKAQIKKTSIAVAESAGLTTQEMQQLASAAAAIWTSSNFTKAEGQQLLADFRAIVACLPTKSQP